MTTQVIDLCEVSIFCAKPAAWICRIKSDAHGGRLSRRIPACTEHRKTLEAEAAASRQSVTAEPYQADQVPQ